MIERYRRKWSFIHPYRLSNRTIPRSIHQERDNQSNNSNQQNGKHSANNSNNSNNSEENKLSSIEAAKLRFLQRKSIKK